MIGMCYRVRISVPQWRSIPCLILLGCRNERLRHVALIPRVKGVVLGTRPCKTVLHHRVANIPNQRLRWLRLVADTAEHQLISLVLTRLAHHAANMHCLRVKS